MPALKQGLATVPLPVKKEVPLSKRKGSRKAWSSSRASSAAPTEDSGYFSTTFSAAGSTISRPTTRSGSQTPAIPQTPIIPQTPTTPQQPAPSPSTPSTPQYTPTSPSRLPIPIIISLPKSPPSVGPRKNAPDATLSQAQHTRPSKPSLVVPPIDKSPTSNDYTSLGTDKTPVDILSEKNLGVMQKKKDKMKGQEVAMFPPLSVIHEAELNEDLYRDLFGIPTDFNIGSWSSSDRQSVPNIRPSHSKRTEKSAPDPEICPVLGLIVESSSSTAQKTILPPRPDHLLRNASAARDPYFGGYEFLEDEEEVDMSEWDIYKPGIDSDDDMDGIKAASLWDRQKRVFPLTEKELNFCRKVFNSTTKIGSINQRENRFEQRGERLYSNEILIHG
jgi:hypothetical protein